MIQTPSENSGSFSRLLYGGSISAPPVPRNPNPKKQEEWFLFLFSFALIVWIAREQAMAGPRIPGTDASEKLEAAGTVLRLVDSVVFSWGARIFAGLCVLSSGWHLKEQRFGLSVLCVVGAVILGTTPTWVKNIFDIGGGSSVFTSLDTRTAVSFA